jgi:hypothetical protein
MATQNLYLSVDNEGSVVAVIGSNGEVLERRSYSAAGVATYMLPDGTVVPSSPTGIDIGYHGNPIDEVTGLSSNKDAWYSPVLGTNLGGSQTAMRGNNRPTFEATCIMSQACEKHEKDCNGNIIRIDRLILPQVEVTATADSSKGAEALAKEKAMTMLPMCPDGYTAKGPTSFVTSRIIGQ